MNTFTFKRTSLKILTNIFLLTTFVRIFSINYKIYILTIWIEIIGIFRYLFNIFIIQYIFTLSFCIRKYWPIFNIFTSRKNCENFFNYTTYLIFIIIIKYFFIIAKSTFVIYFFFFSIFFNNFFTSRKQRYSCIFTSFKNTIFIRKVIWL